MDAFHADAAEAARVERVRRDLPSLGHEVFLNNGTFGPLPRQSFEAMQEVLGREQLSGRILPSYHERSQQLQEEARCLLAGRFGASPDEIALTPRTTDGLDIALWGSEWHQGDEILTTGHEHPGLLLPLAALAQRFGLRVTVVDTPPDPSPAAWIAAFAARCSARTRALAFSHVFWTNGEVLPVAEIGAFARREGFLTVVDGAQAAGALRVDLPQSGLDFYALPGQKWLCGPDGTGALYVAATRLEQCRPTFVGYMSGTTAAKSAERFRPAAGARRYEIGAPAQVQLAGLVASLRWQDALDPAWAVGRIAALGRSLRHALAQLPGVEVATREGAAYLGLVSFRLGQRPAVEVAAALGQRGFRLRHLPAPHAFVRVSCGFYTSDEELGRLVQAIAELAVAV